MKSKQNIEKHEVRFLLRVLRINLRNKNCANKNIADELMTMGEAVGQSCDNACYIYVRSIWFERIEDIDHFENDTGSGSRDRSCSPSSLSVAVAVVEEESDESSSSYRAK
jgi:hypothetical protein